MGLGIFSEIENLEEARKRVCYLLETLKDHFLLSQGSGKNYVKMHDVVRDVAIYIASEGRHVFMVSHSVNSEEFPRRTSCESYSHMSIVAQKIDDLPKPIFFPILEMIFFVGMNKLNVLSLSGYEDSILPFPKSVQLLSNLRTLSLINLRLDDISIIGELVTLEILTIRDSTLEVLPVEIGKLTNLILLEFWNERVPLENISPGELTLVECSGDVIHSNLDLSSKLTRYYLNMGQQVRSYHDSSLMDNYHRIIVLDKSELVHSRGNGSKNNVKDLLLADCDSMTHLLDNHCQNNIPFPKLERLEVIRFCSLHYLFSPSLVVGNSSNSTVACSNDDEEEISQRTHIRSEGNMVQVMKFPNLYYLDLHFLECFTHFCSDTVEGIDFPQLQILRFWELLEFQNFWPIDNNSIADSNPLFDEKVSCPNLEELQLNGANSIAALCSHQLPTDYFSKLKILLLWNCGKLRNLMSPSVARSVLNLQILSVEACQSVEEVNKEEELVEERTIKPLFPQLEKLVLEELPKLGHFFLTKHALEFPFLGEVRNNSCPEMKTFSLGSVSTHSLDRLIVDYAEVKDDLNKAIQQLFNFEGNSTVACPDDEGEEISRRAHIGPEGSMV
ncbi:hypothetical protein R3W88_004553 [Solanum pinnatisectum]|uniref:Disease resistance protein At4g27190-like leucine-rich repeats domain-containing protein n=1 Tax=Solanum pinnatisectum TaxID=50273 RepID=A0AAV9KBK6_9SOLN|nr:hypothetical protein R3W88_004553 [Solanum pinnatisectum]